MNMVQMVVKVVNLTVNAQKHCYVTVLLIQEDKFVLDSSFV